MAERARSGLLTGTHSASPSRPSSRGPSRESSSLHWVPPIQATGLGPGADLSGDVVSPLRQGIPRHSMAATVSVSSLLDALKDDSQPRQPETFEVSCCSISLEITAAHFEVAKTSSKFDVSHFSTQPWCYLRHTSPWLPSNTYAGAAAGAKTLQWSPLCSNISSLAHWCTVWTLYMPWRLNKLFH